MWVMRVMSLSFKEDSMGVVVVPNPKMVVLRVGILRVYPISLRVRLVELFMKRFKLLMMVSLVLDIALVRVGSVFEGLSYGYPSRSDYFGSVRFVCSSSYQRVSNVCGSFDHFVHAFLSGRAIFVSVQSVSPSGVFYPSIRGGFHSRKHGF